jgi:WD40 repeat protein
VSGDRTVDGGGAAHRVRVPPRRHPGLLRRLRRPPRPGGPLAAVPLSDGRILLATAGHEEVRLWDPVTATPAGELTGHTGRVNGLAAMPLPDRRTLLATAGDDRAVLVWCLDGMVEATTGNSRS